MDTKPFTAKCHCGAVTLTATRAPFLQLVCHCQQCRDVAKTPSTGFAMFKRSDVSVQGELRVHPFVADSGANTTRQSCAACGDMMIDTTEGFPKMLGVVADRLEPPFQFAPSCHLWTENAVAPVTAPPGVAVHPRGMP